MRLYVVFSVALGTGASVQHDEHDEQAPQPQETAAETAPQPQEAAAQVPVQVHIGEMAPLSFLASGDVRVSLTPPLLVLAASEAEAYAQGLAQAGIYAEDASWGTPSVIVREIPQGMEIHGWRLHWQAEGVPEPTVD